MKNPKFQIFLGADDQFYFRLFAVNGQIILGSEGYTTREGCQNGIDSVKENASLDERFDRKTTASGGFYFTLTAANHQPIGNSETYTTEAARDNGIESVMKTAPDAGVEDTTE
jgi:uncharacterized protein YegP (UPF0339 family)